MSACASISSQRTEPSAHLSSTRVCTRWRDAPPSSRDHGSSPDAAPRGSGMPKVSGSPWRTPWAAGLDGRVTTRIRMSVVSLCPDARRAQSSRTRRGAAGRRACARILCDSRRPHRPRPGARGFDADARAHSGAAGSVSAPRLSGPHDGGLPFLGHDRLRDDLFANRRAHRRARLHRRPVSSRTGAHRGRRAARVWRPRHERRTHARRERHRHADSRSADATRDRQNRPRRLDW